MTVNKWTDSLLDSRSDDLLRWFACDCAERALLREREQGREPDPRSWEAVKVARLYVLGEVGDGDLGEARSAARDAAWATAWAARAAAWDAAWAARAAARDAAWAAARDAARDAAESADNAHTERQWQAERLEWLAEAASMTTRWARLIYEGKHPMQGRDAA